MSIRKTCSRTAAAASLIAMVCSVSGFTLAGRALPEAPVTAAPVAAAPVINDEPAITVPPTLPPVTTTTTTTAAPISPGVSAPAAQTQLVITDDATQTINDVRYVGQRLVFSTVAGRVRPTQTVEIANGTASVQRFSAAISNNASFRIDGESGAFEIAPGAVHSVTVAFEPKATGVITGQLLLVGQARSDVAVDLSGVNAVDFEGNAEPNLQNIFDALGYKINAGVPALPPTDLGIDSADTGNSISKLTSAVGDEVLTKGFKRVDATQPVGFVPLANYISRSTEEFGPYGLYAIGQPTETQRVLGFHGADDGFGGDNQQLLPGLGNGAYSGLVDGVTSVTPNWESFGVWDGYRSNFTEDALNAGTHAMRIYPVITANGPVANAYIVAGDASTAAFKNYDYQDVVFLLSNVQPL